MEKEITEQILIDLIEEFKKYTKTAEQHEFAILALLQINIEKTNLKTIINDQRNARAMCRCICRVIGKDYTEFKENDLF